MPHDPALLRALLLLAPLLLGSVLWAARRPRYREKVGILFALLWNAVSLLAVNAIAIRVGWWSFGHAGGAFLGVPVDLLFGWSVVWTCLATLVLPRWPVAVVVTAAVLGGLWLDGLLMPLTAPLVVLHRHWLVGECASLAVCLAPAILLARWTADNRHLPRRVMMHVVLFAVVMLWIVPAVVLEQTDGDWSVIATRPLWLNLVFIQLILLPAVVGISAVQELSERGSGTPVPLDPPSKLVTSGTYAYVANPMQTSMCLVFVGWGLLLGSWIVSLASLMIIVFGIGWARWVTKHELERRFGNQWHDYRATVRSWVPTWRPQPLGNEAPARLYVDLRCAPCRQVADWIRRRDPVSLEVIDASKHPSKALARISYEADSPGDAAPYATRGVVALACALGHTHLGWAYVGWITRLPIVHSVIQVLVDAVGGGALQASSSEDQL